MTQTPGNAPRPPSIVLNCAGIGAQLVNGVNGPAAQLVLMTPDGVGHAVITLDGAQIDQLVQALGALRQDVPTASGIVLPDDGALQAVNGRRGRRG